MLDDVRDGTAIGLLVDDAIVVVENVERVMTEEGLPKEATRKIHGPDSGRIGGYRDGTLVGGIYSDGLLWRLNRTRQFSITIVSAMALSVLVVLILTPALRATMLKTRSPKEIAAKGKRLSAGLTLV